MIDSHQKSKEGRDHGLLTMKGGCKITITTTTSRSVIINIINKNIELVVGGGVVTVTTTTV